jgi:hypothetical protein
MFHSEMFTSSIATGAQAFAQVNFLAQSNVLAPLNLGLQVSPTLPSVMFVAGISVNAVHVRIQTPSELPFPWPTLSPNNRGGAAESPPRVHDFSLTPLPMRATDEFDVFATQNAAGAQAQYVMVSFCDGPPQPLPVQVLPPTLTSNPATPGRFFQAHWTAAATVTAGAWTRVQPTFDQALPAGYYAVVGARVLSATALFFRLYPAMGPIWRPGGVAVQAYDQLDPPNQRYLPAYCGTPHGWGAWLSFYQNVPPGIELFCTGADTAEEGWFDLVYVATSTTQPS